MCDPKIRQIGSVEVRVDLPVDRVFFCENEQKFVRWVEDFWPLYCPICGRGVHKQLSTHHEMIVNGEGIECSTCEGRGWKWSDDRHNHGEPKTCPDCDGFGVITEDDDGD